MLRNFKAAIVERRGSSLYIEKVAEGLIKGYFQKAFYVDL